MKIFILLLMIFLHIVDDYYLQGILAKLKQKSWWEENAPNKLYEYDYIVALLMHSFSWTFMIMLPLFWTCGFNVEFKLIYVFMINVITHAFVDNWKANIKGINLIQDQSMHLIQIVITWLYL